MNAVKIKSDGRFGGVILAGGRSSRMGRPKAWLPCGDRTMLAAVVDAVVRGLPPTPSLVVVGAPGQDLPPLADAVVRVDDEVEGEGPLRGMEAGLGALEGQVEAAFVSSCDTPLLKPVFVSRMIALLGAADIAVPRFEDRHHPLAAVYRLSVLGEIRTLLAGQRRRPFFLFERVRTVVVDEAALRDIDPELDSLRNFNTPAEYEALTARLSGSRAIGGRS